MGTFIGSTFQKAGKGKGASSAYNLYTNKLEFLNTKYQGLEEEITDEAYFTEKREIMNEALNNPAITAIKKNDIISGLNQLNNDESFWKIKNDEVFKMSLDKIKETVEDNWNDIWQNREILQSGNTGVMAGGMVYGGEDSIESMISQLDGMRSFLEENVPGSSDKVTAIEKNIEYLDTQADFWRGVESNPMDYAVTADTDSNGNIKDFKIVNINDAEGQKGMRNTGAEYGGLKLYGRPNPNLTTDDGVETIVIGNNRFTGSENAFALSEGFEYNTASFKNIPFGNYSDGTVLESSGGKYFVTQKDGSVMKYKDKDMLEADGFSSEGTIKLRKDEEEDMSSLYKIDAKRSQSTLDREAEAQAKLEQVRSQYDDEQSPWSNESVFSPDRAKEAAAIAVEAGKVFLGGAKGVGKGMIDAGGLVGKGVEKTYGAITGGYKKTGKALYEKGKTIADTTGKIFKGIFGGKEDTN